MRRGVDAMTVELTRDEAEALIAVLAVAEGLFAGTHPELAEALTSLRPWRTALVETYLRSLYGWRAAT